MIQFENGKLLDYMQVNNTNAIFSFSTWQVLDRQLNSAVLQKRPLEFAS